ncbi:hypothetical protein WMF18_17210 [Sorangium sp. So ce315]|uniref:hypothetical protein n=1 Tax=Sorangium sp. So ce315 TaxID=3133299 RepID=UPI003F61AF3C
MSSKRPVSVFMGDELEQRLHARRIAGGRIRSFSDVAREAMEKGLDVIEREARSPTLGAPRYSANNNAGGAPECA